MLFLYLILLFWVADFQNVSRILFRIQILHLISEIKALSFNFFGLGILILEDEQR
jgi:hypothetical protein